MCKDKITIFDFADESINDNADKLSIRWARIVSLW
jgi:hypothetical protein